MIFLEKGISAPVSPLMKSQEGNDIKNGDQKWIGSMISKNLLVRSG